MVDGGWLHDVRDCDPRVSRQEKPLTPANSAVTIEGELEARHAPGTITFLFTDIEGSTDTQPRVGKGTGL
jgi:class 3 adenylate cyclase